jgi:hypothetical protein
VWLGEPHPFPERGPTTRLNNVEAIKLKKNDQLKSADAAAAFN